MLPTNASRLGVGNGQARMPGTQGGLISRVMWIARVLAVSLCLAGLPLQSGLAASLAQDNVLVITSPGEGATLSGEVAIQGTATNPNFVSYGVLYAPGSRVTGETSWNSSNPIAWNVQNMVVNGVLGTWDTTQVPNGQYVLALVVYEAGNETPLVHFVNNLTVNNEEMTPTPEPTATPNPEETTQAEATSEPLPPPAGATIVQPATATPRPTPTLLPGGAAGTGDSGSEDGSGGLLPEGIFSIEAVKQAFVLGAQLAVLIYAVGILYVVAKAVIRYYLRQTKRKPSP